MASVPPSIEPPGAAGGGDDEGGAIGPPPAVSGRDAIKARAFERLFGGGDAARPAQDPSSGDGSATLGRAPVGNDGTPEQIGRFKVLGRLGKGGMGVVWSAWDPELERRVAIKVLRGDLDGAAGSIGHARLLREAQAMAKINHPHVIAVHEVGSLGEQVFVAMELVEGTTLTAWLTSARHGWRETLALFLAAGDGIAAAHAAGVVHRDFKPDNVLVGNDGRVRVVDFGLARAAADVGTTIEPAPMPESDAMSTPLTRTGAIMGTPAYMSPEQWLGRAADERSDQFSFCVALFEALHGRRPFSATTVPELAGAVTSGKIDPSITEAGIPRFVDQALRRGLSRDPDARFAAMADLLLALRRDPARTWRRVTAIASVALVASAATLWLATDRAASRCDGVGERLAGVWDDDVRARVEAALLATDAPFAERTRESTVRLVDGYAATWIAAAGEACASAQVAAANQDDARRERCLDTRVAELRALTDLLASADIGVAMQAVDAAARLPDPRVCADPRRLVAYREIADTQARNDAAAARATLGRAGAAGAVGRYADATAQASAVEGIARDLDDPALEAAALLVRGQNEAAAGDNAKGEQSLRRAVSRAELADDHATRAQALTHLVFIVGQDSARFAEARALGADAGAVLRVIGADPLLRAQLDGALGVAAKRGGDLDLALEHHRAALDATRELYGDDHPATLRALANLAITLRALRRDDEAEPMLREATDGLMRVLGENHPAVATSLSNLAIAVAQRGRPDEAVALMRRSLAIRERNDPGHPSIATGHFNLARALYDTRSYADALAQYEEGLARKQKATPDDPAIASYWAGIGRCALRLGDIPKAQAAFEHQLELDETSDLRGEADAARVDLARTLIGSDPRRAKALVERARRGIDDRGNRDSDQSLVADITIVEMLVDSVLLAREHGDGASRTPPP
jgi:tetratricopeptide (TPR) repeat protein